MSSHTFKPDMPPPNKVFGPMAWMRANLFSSWLNTLLTLLAFYLIYLVVALAMFFLPAAPAKPVAAPSSVSHP